MNDSAYNQARETSWRRKLSPEEEASLAGYLAAHPQAQAQLEEDQALTDLMRQLPQPPLASNFTARVLQAVEAEARQQERRAPAPTGWVIYDRLRVGLHLALREWAALSADALAEWRAWMGYWAPRLAPVALFVMLGLAAFYQYRIVSRSEMARNAATLSSFTAIQNPEIFQDLDAIHQLPVVADEELLAALQ